MLAGSALFIFGTFLGCAVYRLLGIGESELYDNLIERYFLALFYKCDSGGDILRVVADCCLHELWVFFAVFAAGFTLYSVFVSAAALLWRGILFGFSLTMLQFSSRTGLLLDSIVYLAAALAISLLLIILAAHAAWHFHSRAISRRSFTFVFLRILALACVNVIFMLFLLYVYI